MSGLTDKETFNSEVIKPKTTLTRSVAFRFLQTSPKKMSLI
ncbi:hypothetical protein BN1423_1630006 [Carnobacterium maltaromaticum]|nr:hypothetical protein BN1423_1630006 [Carnobacterium maltaromaticum]